MYYLSVKRADIACRLTCHLPSAKYWNYTWACVLLTRAYCELLNYPFVQIITIILTRRMHGRPFNPFMCDSGFSVSPYNRHGGLVLLIKIFFVSELLKNV